MTLGCVYCSYGSWDLFREAYAAIEVSPWLGREHNRTEQNPFPNDWVVLVAQEYNQHCFPSP